MRFSIKGVALVAAAVVATVFVMFAFVSAEIPPVNSELTADEKTTEFLSSVVGINLTEYNLTSPLPPPGFNASLYPSIAYRYPPELCGLVKEESRSFEFEANESKIHAMSILYNGQIVFFTFDAPSGQPIYRELPANDLLGQVKTLLQRYRAYADRVYATNNSYLELMQTILDSVEELSSMNVTVGNVNFQVSMDADRTRIQWIYVENGVYMTWKRVDIEFRNNILDSFIDSWRIYKVSGPSVITSQEAYELALDTAQNTEFRIVNEYRNETVTLPDLSDSVYEMYFTMLPYRNETSDNPSRISRDPLTLYPYWQFYFYFSGGQIAGYSGIQVGIWGDTKEIIYCNGYGFHDFN